MGRHLLHFIFFSTLLFSSALLAEESTEQPIKESKPVEEAAKFIELSQVPEEAAKAAIALNEVADTLAEDENIVEFHSYSVGCYRLPK